MRVGASGAKASVIRGAMGGIDASVRIGATCGSAIMAQLAQSSQGIGTDAGRS